MERLNIGVDLDAIFEMQINEHNCYNPGLLLPFCQRLMGLNHQVVELFVFSMHDPSISSIVFDSLSYYGLNINQLIFTGGSRRFHIYTRLKLRFICHLMKKVLGR